VAVFACALWALVAGPGAGAAAGVDAARSPIAETAGKAKRNRFIAAMESGLAACANGRRANAGLGPLTVDLRLARAARFHAQSMAKHGFFSHTDGSGRTPQDRIRMFAGRGTFSPTGENLAAGQRGTTSVCRLWMGSSAHRQNIFNPRFTHVGGGFALGGRYRRYYVMDLGRLRG
jgi:uncharacterized protein YkwD